MFGCSCCCSSCRSGCTLKLLQLAAGRKAVALLLMAVVVASAVVALITHVALGGWDSVPTGLPATGPVVAVSWVAAVWLLLLLAMPVFYGGASGLNHFSVVGWLTAVWWLWQLRWPLMVLLLVLLLLLLIPVVVVVIVAAVVGRRQVTRRGGRSRCCRFAIVQPIGGLLLLLLLLVMTAGRLGRLLFLSTPGAKVLSHPAVVGGVMVLHSCDSSRMLGS